MGYRRLTRTATAVGALGAGLAAYLFVIRPRELRLGATDAEVARPMPGDDLVTRPTFAQTAAITVAAPPERIWPWLLQLGFGRAGWYSHDWLDNGGHPSADRIIPEFQDLSVGDLVPMVPGSGTMGGIGMWVAALEPSRAMVLSDRRGRFSWAWLLDPLDDGRTRLISRARVRYEWSWPETLFDLLVELGDTIMMREHLRGIRRRAEATATA